MAHPEDMRHAPLAELRTHVRSRRALEAEGVTARELERALAQRSLIRIRRGWFISADFWGELWPESRHRAHVLAVALSARGAHPVFSHESAGVLWSLPLWRTAPSRVHVLAGTADRHSIPDLMRHEGRIPDADIVEHEDLRFTSLERTTYDLIRTLSPEAALAAADAAVALIAGDGRAYDADAADTWLDGLHRRVAHPGARGVRQARRTVELADGRAQLPLESVARLQLVRLGFARPRLQVPVPAPRGKTYWVDLGLDDVNAFCEADGKGKYLEEALRSGLTLEQVLLNEKQREDWIRGTTQRPLARVDASHVESASAMGRRLASFHIFPRR